MKTLCQKLAENKVFEILITVIIIINSVLIGVETYNTYAWITLTQTIILGIFTLEILIRFIAAKSLKEFFSSGWNVFDLLLVVIGYIPESIVENASMMLALRVLRVFRVLRLLRSSKEIKLIVTVLIKSMSSMFYNLILFIIFIYLFAIIGVGVFKLPDPNTLSGIELENYNKYLEVAPHAPSNSADPFGTLGEAMFTLFRELTGDDWTDLRYNHITASEYKIISVNSTFITIYHILWFSLSGFLLLNLVTGAVLNNYQLAVDKQKDEKKE